jgi:guanine deaminase
MHFCKVIATKLMILKGDIIYAPNSNQFDIAENSYLFIKDGKVFNISKQLGTEFSADIVQDYTNHLIIPGFVDLHFHAPQYPNRGLGLDLPLLDWLETYTFPEEAKYSNEIYASFVYRNTINKIIQHGITSVSLYGTIHLNSTLELFYLMARSGLRGYVGKVNMDQNSPPRLKEHTEASLTSTEEFIRNTLQSGSLVKPIITPRFVPTCSPELLRGLGDLAEKYKLPVQSHLNENKGEIAWVNALHPNSSYAQVYNEYGLFGQTPTLMAHTIHNKPTEETLMKKNGVFAVHCPDSNMNLGSGIMRFRKMLNKEINIGIGTDVGAGHDASMKKQIVRTMQLSNLLSERFPQWARINFNESFYHATKGGGQFFGKVGSFEPGYEFDGLIINDSELTFEREEYSTLERLQRFISVGNSKQIIKRFVAGKEIKPL